MPPSCLASPRATLPTARAAPPLRHIAHALETYLNRTPSFDVHWIAVIGEDSLAPSPTQVWDADLSDSLLQICVADGFSEGVLLYVHAQRDRYQPGQVRALLRIKLLCSMATAFLAAHGVWQFFKSAEFESLVNAVDEPNPGREQALRAKKSPQT